MKLIMKEKIKSNGIFWAFLLVLIMTQPINAQFTITEDFKGSNSPGIIIGDDAYLTSGIDDPLGAGWLRLTPTPVAPSNNTPKKGYAFIQKSFPSSLGLLIDFEYTMWRERDGNGGLNQGGDGLGIFLFDANYGPDNFELGGYGGSLGYASSSEYGTLGVTGGYLGVGLDAYGNFSNRMHDGKNGGADSERPNSITLRGPTTDNANTTTRYLKGVTILDNGQLVDALGTPNANPYDNVIDYNDYTQTRPDLETFYRRVQLEIIPTPNGNYRLVVRWATTYAGEFTELIDYETTDIPPKLLKLGFAASSGWAINNHEIRNLLITTPRNLRVTKKTNKETLRSVNVGGNENQIEYTIEIVNNTDDAYTNASFSDELLDINGSPIPTSMFTIDNISHSGFNSINIAEVSNENKVEGDLNIDSHTIGYITISGTLNAIPPSNVLRNSVTVLPTNGLDFDLGNNTSTVSTPVIAENVDLTLEKAALDQTCLDPVNGNSFELHVTNKGAVGATYRRTGDNSENNKSRIVVIKDIPSGFTYDDSATPGGFQTDLNSITGSQKWSRQVLNNTPTNGDTRYIYIARGASDSDQSLPGMGTNLPDPIRYTIIPPSGTTSYDDISTVEYRGANGNTAYDGENIETSYSPPNTANNVHTETIATISNPPRVASDVIYYCQGEAASKLTAEADAGNTLIWYLNEGGAPSLTALTPFTDTPGSTTYYVSQTNGNCESELQEIEVVVLENSTPGSISGGEEICINSTPSQIGSTTDGTGEGTISYRWEYSEDSGTTWETVSGKNQASYQPGAIQTDTQFRRITIADSGNTLCESESSNVVTITTRNCMLITNPMLPSKAKQ